MEIGSPRELRHPVLKALSFKPPRILHGRYRRFAWYPGLCLLADIGLPRIRRELSAGETRACSFIVLLSLLVLGFNVTRDHRFPGGEAGGANADAAIRVTRQAATW